MKIKQYECVLKNTNEIEYNGPEVIRNEDDMFEIFKAYGLNEFAEEKFLLLTMNSGLEPTGIFEIAKGKPDQMAFDLRELFKRACLMNATIIAVAHNHPQTGKAIPSEEDLELTEKICTGCEILGISFADHVIMTLDDEMSMRQDEYIE